jgi:hypothetical protein
MLPGIIKDVVQGSLEGGITVCEKPPTLQGCGDMGEPSGAD